MNRTTDCDSRPYSQLTLLNAFTIDEKLRSFCLALRSPPSPPSTFQIICYISVTLPLPLRSPIRRRSAILALFPARKSRVVV